MEKEKYIQLPPIPEELDGNVVRLIWEYTKLPLSDDPRKTEAILATYMLFLDNGNGDVGMPSYAHNHRTVILLLDML